MTSETDIANLALTRLGHAMISSLDEESKGAQMCRLHFDPTRDALLRAHPWGFAVQRAELAPLVTTPAFEFDYVFPLPADCLKVIRTSYDADNLPFTFRIEGRNLLCNETSVAIEYIARVTDTAQWDDLFVDLMAARLAAEIAIAMTDNASAAKGFWDIYNAKLGEARSVTAQEGTPRDVVDATGWLTARA